MHLLKIVIECNCVIALKLLYKVHFVFGRDRQRRQFIHAHSAPFTGALHFLATKHARTLIQYTHFELVDLLLEFEFES